MEDVIKALTQAIRDLFAQGDFGVDQFGSCQYFVRTSPQGEVPERGLSCIAGIVFRNLGATPEDLANLGGSARDLIMCWDTSDRERLPRNVPTTPREWLENKKVADLMQSAQTVHDRAARLYRTHQAKDISTTMKQAVALAIAALRDEAVWTEDDETVTRLYELVMDEQP